MRNPLVADFCFLLIKRVCIAFVLVITIEIPSRVYSGTQKEKFLLKTSWLTDFIYSVFSPFVFVDAYSKSRKESDNG
ncbi:MAG: hypothetical protein IIT56_12170, partial [Bacteroidales bacterium]|nr:hypothetical protein [Bacteroidales bacterium]